MQPSYTPHTPPSHGSYAIHSSPLSASAISVHTGTPQRQRGKHLHSNGHCARDRQVQKPPIIRHLLDPLELFDEFRKVTSGEKTRSANNARNREPQVTLQYWVGGGDRAWAVSGPRLWQSVDCVASSHSLRGGSSNSRPLFSRALTSLLIIGVLSGKHCHHIQTTV